MKQIRYLLILVIASGLLISSYRMVRADFGLPDALEIWMLDIGQGESVLVREPGGQLLLFDGGPDDSVLAQLGSVLPPWQRQLNLVILSHPHSDHLRGLISALKHYQVQEVWTSGASQKNADYQAFRELLAEQAVPHRQQFFDPNSCKTALPCPPLLQFGQATLQVYHPLRDMSGSQPSNPHDATLAVKVSYRQQSLFLTGDLDEQHEAAIQEACPPPQCSLAATALQVPHHGSATGLAPQFLTAIAPKVALIPVGVDNRYNHPAPLVLQRLGQQRIPTYRTDTQGRIHVVLFASGSHTVAILDSS